MQLPSSAELCSLQASPCANAVLQIMDGWCTSAADCGAGQSADVGSALQQLLRQDYNHQPNPHTQCADQERSGQGHACSRFRTSSNVGRFSASVSQHSVINSTKALGMCSGTVGRQPMSTLKNTCIIHSSSSPLQCPVTQPQNPHICQHR